MKREEFLSSANKEYLEYLQELLAQGKSIDPAWQKFFAQNNSISSNYRPKWSTKKLEINSTSDFHLQEQLLIDKYRRFGHLASNLDPLGLDLGLTPSSLGLEGSGPLSSIAARLFNLYCQTSAVEFEHIESAQEKNWLYNQFEQLQNTNFTAEEKQRFLNTLLEVEIFENYLHTKFPGAKRFSIEGGESCILALDEIVYQAAESEVREILFATAHRGRLATLAKVIGKPYMRIFAEFAGVGKTILDERYSGDVKYHMGYSNQRNISGKDITLSLAYNPSHLESVNPVLAGMLRAKQDTAQNPEQILGVIVHGDAAFCGQGVVAESIAMSALPAYSARGIIHLVINNQVGFTADPNDTRSSRYPSEFAKIAKLPIIHVNGNDPQALIRSIRLACAYRKRFARDVVIDVFCYRKYGHNEGDEPFYTQPVQYSLIKNKPPVAQIYAEKLIQNSELTQEHFNELKNKHKDFFNQEFAKLEQIPLLEINLQDNYNQQATSGLDKLSLQQLGAKIFSYPADFAINPKLAKLFAQRAAEVANDGEIDWGIAENLAFASILAQGINIRLSGQDVGRGTFSHRHSVLHSQTNIGEKFIPLNTIQAGKYQVYNSLLSEFGVLGFEYGYSLASNDTLVIWEAQFGDFANGAQTIIDQFISSGESKWLQVSNLVCLLPHGYEGQGPEHSSARVERFLALAAHENMIISMPSSPASYFHLLRRHIAQKVKKPLIIFSPKSLLRHKLAISSLHELNGKFHAVIAEQIEPSYIKKVIICSGKFYYDLLQARNNQDIAIIRLEQFYPFPKEALQAELAKYLHVKNFIWCQEEPINMGAAGFIADKIKDCLPQGATINCIAPAAESSPAVGYLNIHNQRHEKLIQQVLKL